MMPIDPLSEPADETFVLPAALIRGARRGLYQFLGEIWQNLQYVVETSGHEEHPEWSQRYLLEQDEALELANAFPFWDPHAAAADCELSLTEHGPTLLKALQIELVVAEDIASQTSEARDLATLRNYMSQLDTRLKEACQAVSGKAASPAKPRRKGRVARASHRPEIMLRQPSDTTSLASTVLRSVREGAGLTQREQQVLDYFTQGLTNKQTAHRLSVTAETIRKHDERIRRKLGITSWRELLSFRA